MELSYRWEDCSMEDVPGKHVFPEGNLLSSLSFVDFLSNKQGLSLLPSLKQNTSSGPDYKTYLTNFGGIKDMG